MSTGQAWVELVGDLVVARVRGEPTEQLLRETQEKVLFLVSDAGRGRVLYDTLEMTPPPVDVPWSQRQLDEKQGSAFGEGDYRFFYNDMVAAIKWLTE